MGPTSKIVDNQRASRNRREKSIFCGFQLPGTPLLPAGALPTLTMEIPRACLEINAWSLKANNSRLYLVVSQHLTDVIIVDKPHVLLIGYCWKYTKSLQRIIYHCLCAKKCENCTICCKAWNIRLHILLTFTLILAQEIRLVSFLNK